MVKYETATYAPKPLRSRLWSILTRDWPYVSMFILSLFGVSYTSVYRSVMAPYWMVLVPVFCIITVAAQWHQAEGREARWELIRTQTLHWAAVMFAMYLVFVSDVEKMMNADASGLVVLTVLALGTFTAGVHARAWRICLIGAMLSVGVPAIAWLEQSTLLLLLLAVVLATFASFVFLRGPWQGKLSTKKASV
jgi:hypothetical protein